MFNLIPSAYAMNPTAGAAGDNPGMMGQFVLFGVIFLIFYMFVIRPQQKKQKELKDLVSALKKGDQLVTNSGIYGTVSKINDEKGFVMLEIAERTVIKINKDQISQLTLDSE